jgi:peptidoglycan/LPS O-acetylase OafA/YrhL
MRYFKQLDGLRAFAIISVMIAHWHQSSIKIDILKNLPFGSGVTLFFVISGFLITKILLDFREQNNEENRSQFHSIKSFYVRRSLRIFPIYYLTILILFIVGFADIHKVLPWLLSYTTNIYMTLQNDYIGPYTQFWSLAVEEQFYLFWGFLVVFIPKQYIKGTILTLSFLSVLLLIYTKLFTGYWLANSLVICQLHTLGLGALIAYYIKYKPDFMNTLNLTLVKGLALLLSLIFILIYVYQKPEGLYENLKHYKDPFITLIYFFIVLIAVRDGFKGLMKGVLENRVMIYIGKISYGLYIYHSFMAFLFFDFFNKFIGLKTSQFGYTLVFFGMNMIIASISWYLIEKPVTGLKRYFKY